MITLRHGVAILAPPTFGLSFALSSPRVDGVHQTLLGWEIEWSNIFGSNRRSDFIRQICSKSLRVLFREVQVAVQDARVYGAVWECSANRVLHLFKSRLYFHLPPLLIYSDKNKGIVDYARIFWDQTVHALGSTANKILELVSAWEFFLCYSKTRT